MDKAMVARLQKAVGANVDGVMGAGTLASLFMKLGCKSARATALGIAGNKYMRECGVMDTGERFALWMGQLAKESGGFVYMEEIHDGSNYEGRKDLGNTQPGDGKRFKGRGPIQLTGRANYNRVGKIMGIDLLQYPELIANPCLGLWAGTIFWTDKGLNAVCDRRTAKGELNCSAVTKVVNGGFNGLSERIQYTNRVLGWLGLPTNAV